MRRWRLLPNPGRVLDYDGDKISWTYIVDQLSDIKVNFRELDGELYEKLRACESDDALKSTLSEIQRLQNSGELEERYSSWKDTSGEILDNQLRDETDRRYPRSLNNRRFSHRFPLGVDVNDPEAELLGEPIGDGTGRKSAVAEQQLAKPTKWRRCWNYPPWRYIIYPSLIFVPAMGGLIYMWLQEDGCGDRCLDQAS